MQCRILPEGIVVDRFHKGGKYYFLSHLHTDHMSGLHRFSGKLYVSPETRHLLERGTVIPYNQWVDMPFGAVAAIPAGHCTGSVMWAFHVDQTYWLFTGDWMWYPGIRNNIILQELVGKLDWILYDNTLSNVNMPPNSKASDVAAWFAKHPQGVIHARSLGLEQLIPINVLQGNNFMKKVSTPSGYPVTSQPQKGQPVLRLSCAWYLHGKTQTADKHHLMYRTHATASETRRLIKWLKPKVAQPCGGVPV
jgi:hypothetical protein